MQGPKGIQLGSGSSSSSTHRRRANEEENFPIAFVVKVESKQRSEIVNTIKGLDADAWIQYLPTDSYICVFSQHIGEQLAEFDGVDVFYLPAEMKLSIGILQELEDSAEAGSEASVQVGGAEKNRRRTGTKRQAHNRRSGKNADSMPSIQADFTVKIGGTGDDALIGVWWEGLAEAGLASAVGGISGAGKNVNVQVRGEGSVAAVVRWLAARAEVVWIERTAKIKMMALEVELVDRRSESNSTSTGCVETWAPFELPRVLGANTSQTCAEPLVWTQGLLGEGQVVAIGDTGLDYDHCAFGEADGNNSQISVCTNFGECSRPGLHRKVYSYRIWGDAAVGDAVSGHGTHVVGSAVANSTSGSYRGVGVAPWSKVAVEDSSDDVDTGTLYFPNSLLDLFAVSQDAGIRIYSGSWGYISVFSYETPSQEVDQFMHQNEDYLVVVAAGNDGDDFGYQSVGAPALAKNALSVGASSSSGSDIPAFSSRGPVSYSR